VNPLSLQTEHLKRLEWAIRFSQTELDAFREGDWLNLKEEFWEFLYGMNLWALDFNSKKGDPKSTSGEVADALPRWEEDFLDRQIKEAFMEETDHALLREIQASMRRILGGLAANTEKGKSIIQWIPIREADFIISAQGPSQPFSGVFSIDDCMKSSQATLGLHLIGSRVAGDQIRSCPECQRIFLAKRKPRADKTFHCSLRCARLAATRRYQKKLTKESEGKGAA
jgi:hypothetical protein